MYWVMGCVVVAAIFVMMFLAPGIALVLIAGTAIVFLALGIRVLLRRPRDEFRDRDHGPVG